MPRKPNYGPKYTGILTTPVEKWAAPIFSLDTDEKIEAWRKVEIERVKAELEIRHDALFKFHKIEKDSPDAFIRLHFAMCEAHVPGFQVIDDRLQALLDPRQGAGKVVSLFPGRKNKQRSERWKKAFVNSILGYHAIVNATGNKCTDEEACAWFIDHFEDESLKRSGSGGRRKQRVRTLANILSAERHKLKTHTVGAPVS
jgi:hypothetical protein